MCRMNKNTDLPSLLRLLEWQRSCGLTKLHFSRWITIGVVLSFNGWPNTSSRSKYVNRFVRPLPAWSDPYLSASQCGNCLKWPGRRAEDHLTCPPSRNTDDRWVEKWERKLVERSSKHPVATSNYTVLEEDQLLTVELTVWHMLPCILRDGCSWLLQHCQMLPPVFFFYFYSTLFGDKLSSVARYTKKPPRHTTLIDTLLSETGSNWTKTVVLPLKATSLSVWRPGLFGTDCTCIDSWKLTCESDNAIWGPACWLCEAAAGGEGRQIFEVNGCPCPPSS